MRQPLHAAYARLGRRYPRAVLWAQFQLSHFVVAGGVLLFTLYEDFSDDELLTLILVSQGLMLIENVFSFRFGSSLLRPADAWLRGDRSPEAAARAWRALADMPAGYLRRWHPYPVLFNLLPFCITATFVLELPWWGFFPVVGGGLVAIVYGGLVRFFGIELALRPVIEAVARDLPEDFELGRTRVSLRFRLLAGLPLLNIISGVIVASFSTDGTRDVADLGSDVLFAIAVALTVSLELTLLLSRSIIDPIDDLRRATERIARGDLSARVPVVSTDETGALAQSFNEMISGLEERERLRDAFGAFVDPLITERVAREGTMLEGEEVVVTVFFVDIRGFTALSENKSAREVVDLLNEYYGLVVPILMRHGGHANKFIGDGLLGVFGAPDKLADHADRALAAALEIVAAVRARFGSTIEIGVGVNSGPVIAGTVGGGGRVEFTVIGDPVNTASRVEAATRVRGDDVLITGATRALLTHEPVAFEERPGIELRGKSEHVDLFAPVSVPALAGDGAAEVFAPAGPGDARAGVLSRRLRDTLRLPAVRRDR